MRTKKENAMDNKTVEKNVTEKDIEKLVEEVKNGTELVIEADVSINGEESKEETFDVPKLVIKFKNHLDEVKKYFVERDKEFEQIKYALLIKEHILLKGKPGTAKSRIGKYSFGYIGSSKTFAIQLSKFMSEEYLFGAININKMRNEGKVEHIVKDSVVDSEFAFIDEVFDGNDALLRSLLEVLNERTFTRHSQKVDCKLHSAILTSNYVREDEVTEAFLDRILFKSEVRQIESNRNRLDMYKGYIENGDRSHLNLRKSLSNGKGLSYEELNAVSSYILNANIEIPEAILRLYDLIVREYIKQSNVYISDRKSNKMLNIVKASALLNGRVKATFEDIEPIKYALVTANDEQQEELFRAVYSKLMTDNVKYAGVCEELEKLAAVYAALQKTVSLKMNPKSKEILELNEEAQMFNAKIQNHNFINTTGFKDIDQRFAEIKVGTDKIIREIAKVLKLA